MSYQGEPTIRFEIRHGETWESKNGRTFRTELAQSNYPPRESVRFYACNIFIPKDFPIENNRLVLMQWWPRTKTELGEVGRSPSLALRYSNGILSATVRHSDLKVVKDPDAVPNEKIFKTHQFKRGEWNKFIFQAKWSFRKDGFVKVWWNGNQVADYSGPVGYDDQQGPLFKFGIYRDDSPKTYVAYFNRCGEKTSFEGIDPPNVQ